MCLCGGFAALLAWSDHVRAQSRPSSAGRWVTAWGTSQHALGDTRLTNATVRLIARTTISGEAVRLRFDNTFGTEPVSLAGVRVGHRARGAALVAGSNRAVTFNGSAGAVIPAGGTISSDPTPLQVFAHQDLAVSVHVSSSNVRPSQHTNAYTTSYRGADGSGDATTSDGDTPFSATTTAMWWLKAIDVQTTASPGVVVAFGDSITDGTCSTVDAHDRWVDLLSLRLGLERPGQSPAIVNEGIGGNTVTATGLTPPPDSPPGLQRLERDVLSHHGVSQVILFMGTNDIRRGATATAVIQGTAAIIQRIKATGSRVIGATIIPRHNVPPTATNSGWNDEKSRTRNEVNQWIRTGAGFDAVLDFAQIVRDPSDTDRLLPRFNCGDGIHPSVLGYHEMGKAIDLSLFR